jgi:DNA-binding NarL/FixJ family response regulator
MMRRADDLGDNPAQPGVTEFRENHMSLDTEHKSPAPRERVLILAGQANMFFDLVCALLQVACPDAVIRRAVEEQQDWRDGIRVRLEGTDRWMFVSTGGGPDQQCARAVRDGAWAVLNLDSRSEDVRFAIDALVLGSARFVPPDIISWLATAAIVNGGLSDGTDHNGVVRLTAREREVLKLVALGLTNGEIAEELTISTNTVRTHLHSLAVKFESTSRTKMLARAAALGLYEVPRTGTGYRTA